MQPELGISTLSLGSCNHHSLSVKLQAAARAGFTAIDLFDADWAHFKRHHATSNGLPLSTIDGDHTSVSAARAINRMCASLHLRIMCLQPFREFEARKDPKEAAERMLHARGTLSILPILGTSMLLIPSTTLPASQVDPSPHRMAADLAQLAGYAASYSPPIRICYEALSWGTNVSTYRAAWEVVRLANRPNLGLCLDSFNTAAREWADPYSPSGIRDSTANDTLRRSLNDLIATVPCSKIFYFQLADGQRMSPPLTLPEDPTVPPLRPWSRSYRLFPLESARGAYLPVKEFTEAVCKTGYQGPWCLEIFNDSLSETRASVPDEHAQRGMESLRKILAVVGMKGACPRTCRLPQAEPYSLEPKFKNSSSIKLRLQTMKTMHRFLLVFPLASILLLLFKTFTPLSVATPFSLLSSVY